MYNRVKRFKLCKLEHKRGKKSTVEVFENIIANSLEISMDKYRNY